MILKLSFFLLFLNTFLLSNIDIDKKAITIGLSSTLLKSQNIVNNLNKYDLYIYKTTSTKKPYYIIYTVNIKKENQKIVLKSIQKKYKDAYISSDSRVKKLATVNFDNNIFIKSQKNKQQDNKFSDTRINLNKQSLFVTYVKNKKELFSFLKKNRNYNLFIENVKHNNLDNNDRCCAIYIVNINPREFNYIFEIIKNSYNQAKEEQTTFLKYRHERYDLNKFIQSFTKPSK